MGYDQRTIWCTNFNLARGGESVADASAAQPYVFFSPSPARVLFPDLSADVGAKFARYQTMKSALRKELYDAVYREDPYPPMGDLRKEASDESHNER